MISTNNKIERKKAEELWAANKYLFLSKSHTYYLIIRDYIKRDNISSKDVQRFIDKALGFAESKKDVINAYQHIWGYFKDQANKAEKEDFFRLIDDYENDKICKESILEYLSKLLSKYPNEYLENSTIFHQKT